MPKTSTSCARTPRRGWARSVPVVALAVALTSCGTQELSPHLASTPAPAPSDSSTTQPAGVLPDRSLTPGAVATTDVQVVCAPGYSKSVRLPAIYTSRLKRQQLAAGYPGTAGLSTSDVEEDHLVMLALGGDPRSPQNLWPEPRHVAAADGSDAGADVKDQYEAWLYDQVCRQRSIPVVQAQHDLASNWYDAWVRAGRPRGTGSAE